MGAAEFSTCELYVSAARQRAIRGRRLPGERAGSAKPWPRPRAPLSFASPETRWPRDGVTVMEEADDRDGGAHWARKVGLTAAVLLSLAACPALADDPLSVILARRTPAADEHAQPRGPGRRLFREEHLRVATRLTDHGDPDPAKLRRGQSDICPEPIEPMLEHFDDGVRMKMFLSSADSFHRGHRRARRQSGERPWPI